MPAAISRECSLAAAASSSAQQHPVRPAAEPAMPHPRTRRQKREAAGDAGDSGPQQLVQVSCNCWHETLACQSVLAGSAVVHVGYCKCLMVGQLSMFATVFMQAGGGAPRCFQLVTQAVLACTACAPTAACSMQVHSETWYTPF